MTVVLVGGCGDGDRVDVPDNMTHWEVVADNRVNLKKDMVPWPIKREMHRYTLFRLYPATRMSVFIYERLEPADVLNRLLDHYRPTKEQQ